MDNLKNFSNKSFGTLFVIATPIGNMGDISQRALDTFSSVDCIICEDTRVTKKLLSKLSISKKLTVYNDHSKEADRINILNHLQQGKNLAIVSDAGTPLISDPGFKLVELCQIENIKVEPIPGPSALVTALSASGLASDTFFFGGFFPRTSEKSSELLSSAAHLQTTAIFYESPSRILKSLKLIHKLYGKIKVCVAREITKMYEEFLTGDISDIITELESREKIKGEIVLLLDLRELEISNESSITDLLTSLMKNNSLKDSVSIASKQLKLPKSKVYDLALKLKR